MFYNFQWQYIDYGCLGNMLDEQRPTQVKQPLSSRAANFKFSCCAFTRQLKRVPGLRLPLPLTAAIKTKGLRLRDRLYIYMLMNIDGMKWEKMAWYPTQDATADSTILPLYMAAPCIFESTIDPSWSHGGTMHGSIMVTSRTNDHRFIMVLFKIHMV